MRGDKILVVDDDINICDLVRMYLEKEGFEVQCSHDGVSALKSAEANNFSAIVLDIMLPSLNGIEV